MLLMMLYITQHNVFHISYTLLASKLRTELELKINEDRLFHQIYYTFSENIFLCIMSTVVRQLTAVESSHA